MVCEKHKRGFSLVELSIVLVILGLLTGGILAGRSLIRASELRSVGTDLGKFQTSVAAFRDRYFALPGDMANAIDFWGAVHADPGTCRATASNGTLTCNGTGTGTLGTVDGVTNSELFHFWIQLANAGLIEGSYTGIRAVAGQFDSSTPGLNVPASRMNNGGYSVRYCPTTGCWMATPHAGRNVLFFGAPVINSYMRGGILAGEEIWNLDTKLDDGASHRGRLTITMMGDNICDNGNYILTAPAGSCSLIWRLW